MIIIINCNDFKYLLQWFREEVSREAEIEGGTAVTLIELLADAHGPCLQEMEARLARWEGNTRHNIGDFLYNTLLNVLPLYDQYLENLIPALEKMEYSMRTSRRFEQLCRDFEAQKHCYLPLSSFLLKPLQRLLHYNSIIDSRFINRIINPLFNRFWKKSGKSINSSTGIFSRYHNELRTS